MTPLSGVIYSRATDEWCTPNNFFRQLDSEFGFDVDVAATADNAKCKRFFTSDEDGLSQPWAPMTCWLNPPYSQIGPWLAKSREEASQGATVVCLVPSRTDTSWWHDVAQYANETRFVRGRLVFYGDRQSSRKQAPFPSVVLVFRRSLPPVEP